MHYQKLWWAQIDMCMSRYLETRNANLAWYFVDKTSDYRFSSGFLFKEKWKAAEKGAFLLVILLTLSPSPFLCRFWSCWKIRLCPPIVFGICTMFEILCTGFLVVSLRCLAYLTSRTSTRTVRWAGLSFKWKMWICNEVKMLLHMF